MKTKSNKSASTLHYYWVTLISFTSIGIGVSVYLSLNHFWVYTDITYSSFCAISRAINCDTVAQSPWSIFLGLPVSLWGLFGYLLFLLFLLPYAKPLNMVPQIWTWLVLLSGLFSIISSYFGYISATRIHSYCIFCIISYAVNFGLFYFSWLVYRRVRTDSFFQGLLSSLKTIVDEKLFVCLIGVLLTTWICLYIFLPQYWILETPPANTTLETGVTTSGHPWIGAENPKITIEEFSDYQCFQCAKSHLILRQLVARYPQTIRLVHRHYPMDHAFNPTVVQEPFHIGSGKMALLAIYAMTKGKFWEMNDALFELGRAKKPFNTQLLAKKTGIPSAELVMALSHPAIKQQLDRDILRGMKLRILGTPTFVIQDQVYTGHIPMDVLNPILQENN